VTRFLETLFRHRVLVVVPVVLAIAIALGYQAVQPHQYESVVSIWVDGSTPVNLAATPASTDQSVQSSDQEAAVLHELLSTRAFDVAVADRGPLAAYLASTPNNQAGLAAVPVIGKLFKNTAASVDDRVASELPTSVSVVSAGPQVAVLTVDEPQAAVATGTAKALVDQLTAQIVANQTSSDRNAATYYQQQAAGAQADLQTAEKALTAYQADHPSVPANGIGDVSATQLKLTVDLAQQRYETLLGQYQQAQLNLTNVASLSGFRIIDAPSTATLVSSRKRLVMAGIAGVLAGLTLAVIVLLVLTASDRTARRARDVERSLGLEVAASIAHYSPGSPLLGEL
jgi:uncharacterized protein involved in exopolysaccharide biosynthesis